MDQRTDARLLSNNSHLMLAELCGANQRVLELGCGSGAVTEKLAARGCAVWAIDIDPAGIERATIHAEHASVADLDVDELGSIVGDAVFDRIVMGDVIEHLRSPGRLLAELTTLVADGGRLIASVPNVAHADLRLLHLQGQWPYQPLGLLDETHVRFYTPETIRELIESAGWQVVQEERVVLGVFGTELAAFLDPTLIPDGLAASLERDRSATTYQIVIEAVPALAGDRLGSRATPDSEDVEPLDAPTSPRPADPVLALLQENEHLRARVAALSDVIEEAQWAAAERRVPERASGAGCQTPSAGSATARSDRFPDPLRIDVAPVPRGRQAVPPGSSC